MDVDGAPNPDQLPKLIHVGVRDSNTPSRPVMLKGPVHAIRLSMDENMSAGGLAAGPSISDIMAIGIGDPQAEVKTGLTIPSIDPIATFWCPVVSQKSLMSNWVWSQPDIVAFQNPAGTDQVELADSLSHLDSGNIRSCDQIRSRQRWGC